MMKFRPIGLVALYLSFYGSCFANNIQVSDVGLKSQNTTADLVTIQFDLSWENSWRTSGETGNRDAAWIFAKFRIGSGNWQHASLDTSGSHTNPSGATITDVPGGVGVFLHRQSDGVGAVNYPDVGLRWNYGASGVSDTANIEVKIFAIEMVYVPEGAFYLGDPEGDSVNTFHSRKLESTGGGGFTFVDAPYRVASDGPITYNTGPFSGFQYKNDQGFPGDQAGPIPEEFPVGFNAFYCMKYEVTQQQWVDFFNTLTDTQKILHDITSADGKNSDVETSRNAISWPDSGAATTSNPDVPVSYVGYSEVTAYLDWAGLRLMSETEYEKACRGPENVVPNEMAWGNANIHGTSYSLVNDGTASESVSNPGQATGNVNYSSTRPSSFPGPLRAGIFSASATTKNREETGASYYGIMELTGNLYEHCVTVGSPGGRAFTGAHGDGMLAASGENNVSGWPGPGNSSFRGGSHTNGENRLYVSDRYDGASSSDIQNSRLGFRGVRTAP